MKGFPYKGYELADIDLGAQLLVFEKEGVRPEDTVTILAISKAHAIEKIDEREGMGDG
ncbi:hypothetical protein [Aurantiacibacter spongiae]|uniref:hypothetical protein n=1 Tax=Aurantiacibacter spongiae TaxID=2488860 RepID=UPI00131525E5|nr:hypothetical protein [Aurantiacibacter spongiae]